MKIMNVKGLTLYHLKSHLQKYRLSKQPESDQNTEATEEAGPLDDGSHGQDSFIGVQNPKEPMEIAYALKAQMTQLQEQLEVQRRLQMRIEAQSRYLQTILEKAEEAFACQATAPARLEMASAELTDLVSNAENEYLIPSLGAFPLSSLPGLPWLETAQKSGGEESDTLARGKQLTGSSLESLSPSFAFTQNSTSGRRKYDQTVGSKRSKTRLSDGIPRFWSNKVARRFNIGGHESNTDESLGSSVKTDDMPGNMCMDSLSHLTWKDFSNRCSQ